VNQLAPDQLQAVFSSQSSEKLAHAIETQIFDLIKSQFGETTEFNKIKSDVSKVASNTASSIASAIKQVLPESWYDKIKESLKEDLREITVGPRSDEDPKRIRVKKIYNNIVNSQCLQPW